MSSIKNITIPAKNVFEFLIFFYHLYKHLASFLVSGYSSTLIKNMRKTSSQLKKNMKKLLNEIEVNPRSVNYLENSKNIELSAFSEALNVGASVEADIVHSEESKIPRSLYSRFDLDVFDHNINFFEASKKAYDIRK